MTRVPLVPDESAEQQISGLDLFLGQAIDAFEVFTGQRLTEAVIAELEAYIEVEERQRTL